MPLTKRQKDILDFLTSYLQQQGYSPTLEEIADFFGMASLNAVFKHLRVLEERGFIRRLSNRARSIEVLKTDHTPNAALPLLGAIAAGRPMEAVPYPEEITVPETFLTRGSNYVLRVEGDSMIDEHIRDGDLVIIEQRNYANNGEVVVALVDGENVTLKKYFREKGMVRLQPANPALDPLLVPEERVKIQGVLVGLMRKY